MSDLKFSEKRTVRFNLPEATNQEDQSGEKIIKKPNTESDFLVASNNYQNINHRANFVTQQYFIPQNNCKFKHHLISLYFNVTVTV